MRWHILVGLVFTLVIVHYQLLSLGKDQLPGPITIEAYYQITPVLINKNNNPVARIKIQVPPESTARLQSMVINTNGSSNIEDIAAIRIYHTSDLHISPGLKPFGEAHSIKPEIEVKGTLNLQSGTHFFLVTYDIHPHANLLNKVQATCTEVNVGQTSYEPRQMSNSQPNRLGRALRKQGDDGVQAFRIPGLVTTNKGTVIAVYDIRRNSAVDLQEDIDVGMSRSTDGGKTWSGMQVIIDMGTWGGKGEIENGVGDPSILVDRKTNTIWVAGIWAHGHAGERNWFASKPGRKPQQTSQLVLVKSEDDGLSWSDPINITDQVKDTDWHLLLQGPGKGITLNDGTLVFPAQFKDENQVPHATIIFSKDGGTSWNIGKGLPYETTEAQVVQLADRRIMINARNNEARNNPGIGRVVATTANFGQTWESHPSSLVALEEPTCMASLIREDFNNYGSLLLFSNPNTHAGRFNITIKASRDEGLSWPQRHWLLLDQGNGRGYSCMTKIDEQTIGILYESSQADLVYQTIEISEIIDIKASE